MYNNVWANNPKEKKMKTELLKKTWKKAIRRCNKLLKEISSYDYSDDPYAQDLACRLGDAVEEMRVAMKQDDYHIILQSYDKMTEMFYRARYYFTACQC